MYPSLNLLLVLALLLVGNGTACLGADSPTPHVSADEVLLFSFFRDNGQNGTYLAYSSDGLHFTPLNNDEPVLFPAKWPGQNLTRDTSMVYHEGKFHAVWTSNWSGRVFGYAESTDLIHWSDPVMVKPFPDALPPEDQPRNVWAPEICWDPIQKNFPIIWSSTTDRECWNGDGSTMSGKEGDWDHRLFITRTSDGKTFTDAKLFFDQKFCCIDGQMAFDDQGKADPTAGRWVLTLKNEREPQLGGKNLRMTFAPADFSNPWTPISGPIVGPGSTIRANEMAEGPSLVRWKGTWRLYWDAFANGHYGMATSPDLQTWTDRTADLKMPPHPRHGTIFRVPRAAVAALINPASGPAAATTPGDGSAIGSMNPGKSGSALVE